VALTPLEPGAASNAKASAQSFKRSHGWSAVPRGRPRRTVAARAETLKLQPYRRSSENQFKIPGSPGREKSDCTRCVASRTSGILTYTLYLYIPGYTELILRYTVRLSITLYILCYCITQYDFWSKRIYRVILRITQYILLAKVYTELYSV
jgi:hypothetical protein